MNIWQSILIGPAKSRVERRVLPKPATGEVLVKTRICGVCASELHPWLYANVNREFGHEVVGEVVAAGEGVALEPGARVTGLMHRGFADYTLVRADKLVAVPEGLPDEAALGEPLACVVSGMRRTKIDVGDTVAVVGLGFMGLLTLQVVNLKGPLHVVGVDTRIGARENALRYGADRVLAPGDVAPPLVLADLKDLPKGYGVDVAIEAAGKRQALDLAGRMAKAHGVLAIIGFHQGGRVPLDMELWNWKGLDVLNAHERRDGFLLDSMRRGLSLVEANKLDTASLVTHKFALDEVDAAFEMMSEKPADYIKSVIEPS